MGYKKWFLGSVGVLGTVGGIVALLMFGGVIGSVSPGDTAPQPNQTLGDDARTWGEYRQSVGMDLGSQQSSETVVLISPGVDAANFNEPDVTSVGADSDSSDEQELFETSDVDEGEEYYKYTTFGSTIKSNLPDEPGTYKVAVIGSGIANEYTTYTIQDKDYSFDIENNNPIRPLQDVDVDLYAADANITTDDTYVVDGSSTIALDANFTDDTTDSNIDGTVTGVKEYSVSGSDRVFQAGHMEISSVDSNVEEVTMTFYADGDRIKQVTDADPTDSDKLNDQVDFGPVTVEDSFEVHTAIEFEDSSVTSSTQFLTAELDDSDDDSTSNDGTYGITKLTETWEGH